MPPKESDRRRARPVELPPAPGWRLALRILRAVGPVLLIAAGYVTVVVLAVES